MATKGNGLRLVSLGIFLASFWLNTVLASQSKCTNIHVAKNEIIQVTASLEAGAEFISSRTTLDARQCYELCCLEDRCDLAQLQYRNSSRGGIERVCFLFRCWSPTRCSFKVHEHHATIHFEKRGTQRPGADVELKPEHRDGGCLPGVHVAMCRSDPCLRASCHANPYAECRASPCGACHAEFFYEDGTKVDCDEVGSEEKDLETPYQPHQEAVGGIGQENVAVHPKIEKLPSRKPTTEVKPKHVDHHSGKEENFKKFEHGSQREEMFVPTAKQATTMEPPTTFHHWREFIDNNPNFPPPTHPKENFQVDWQVKATQAPTTATTKLLPTTTAEVAEGLTTQTSAAPVDQTEQTPRPDNEEEFPAVKPAGHREPATKTATPVQGGDHDIPQVYHPVIQHKLKKNGTDVVLIEHNHLKIVENKAVLPLAIFLVVAILLLFVVALRLRVVKNKLKRRPFATDDADYLINGMYL